MRHRADAADTCHQGRHFVERPPLAEALKTAHLRHMEISVRYFTVFIEMNGDFAVPFQARHGIDGNCLAHSNSGCQAPNRVIAETSIGAPVINEVSAVWNVSAD